MIAVSVIMPVYNVEAYLRRAVDSVLRQTLTDIEVLLVDDGSPDGCGKICDEYAERDPRVTVIHQENRGAPAARNAAIERARGEYLFFCDADDWAEADMLGDMKRLADETNAELVVAGFYIDTYYAADKYMEETLRANDALYETARAFRENASPLFDRNLLYTPWNKLYRANRLRSLGLRFPQTFWDDFPFNIEYLRGVSRVAVTQRAYYHFTRSRAESETAKYVPAMYEKREQEDIWMRELYDQWGLKDAESAEFLARRYAERLIGCMENLTNPKCGLRGREKRARMREMLNAPRAKEALALSKPETFLLRALFLPLRRGWVWWTYIQSLMITFVKGRSARLFARLKAGRGKAKRNAR